MSKTLIAPTLESNQPQSAPPKERRRQPRAKLSAPLRVRAQEGSAKSFTDVCTTLDASRDGLFFRTSREGFFQGQLLAITFPYSGVPSAQEYERAAEVVRVVLFAEGQCGIAIRYFRGATNEVTGPIERAPIYPTQFRDDRIAQPLCLAVDNDARVRAMLETVLRKDGYEVVALASPAAALEVLRERIPAMLIAEIENDEMSGYDLCLVLKTNPRLQHVPIALTTRSAKPTDYSTAHALGAVICMAKPYKPQRLLLVARLLAPPLGFREPAMISQN